MVDLNADWSSVTGTKGSAEDLAAVAQFQFARGYRNRACCTA
jgi:hypothetical protein